MNREIYIVSSDFSLKENNEVFNFFQKKKVASKQLIYERISSLPDVPLAPYKKEHNDNTIEKGYEKDENLRAAQMIHIQKAQLNNILSSISLESTVYICEEYIPEYFYLRKHLFKNKSNFFSFGKILDEKDIAKNRFALDIGVKIDGLKYSNQTNLSPCSPCKTLSSFNGHIAIDPPPDAIPYSHLGYFRSPLNFVRALISFLNSYYKNRCHPSVKIIDPSSHNDVYRSSKRAVEIAGFLGKRGEQVESAEYLEKNCTVITWSTAEFFRLLNSGLKAVPATRCGASSIFSKSAIGERILDHRFENKMGALIQFYREKSL